MVFFKVENGKFLEFYWCQSLLFESDLSFSKIEIDDLLTNQNYSGYFKFDESRLNFVEESWLYQNNNQISICIKCGYGNPYIDFNANYICRSCRIGY